MVLISFALLLTTMCNFKFDKNRLTFLKQFQDFTYVSWNIIQNHPWLVGTMLSSWLSWNDDRHGVSWVMDESWMAIHEWSTCDPGVYCFKKPQNEWKFRKKKKLWPLFCAQQRERKIYLSELALVRRADKTWKMHACSQVFYETGKIQTLSICVFWMFSLLQQKFVQNVKVILENVKSLAQLLPRPLLVQRTSELLIQYCDKELDNKAVKKNETAEHLKI